MAPLLTVKEARNHAVRGSLYCECLDIDSQNLHIAAVHFLSMFARQVTASAGRVSTSLHLSLAIRLVLSSTSNARTIERQSNRTLTILSVFACLSTIRFIFTYQPSDISTCTNSSLPNDSQTWLLPELSLRLPSWLVRPGKPSTRCKAAAEPIEWAFTGTAKRQHRPRDRRTSD